MPRRPRLDEPGSLHHVMNRGLARRTIIESRPDARYFMALLACACRRGQLEILAFSLLATHFHLVVRSLRGELSKAMRWILQRYVRYFNRTRHRDGPLMRGRFRSIRVATTTYKRTLVRYIDQNAVDAGLVARPAEYAYGSARWLRRSGCRPLWLSRDLVDSLLAAHAPEAEDREEAYDRVFQPRLTDRQRNWIERRIAGKARGYDEVDRLLGRADRVLRWALRKARLADGTPPELAVVDPDTADQVLEDASSRLAEVDARPPSGRVRNAADLMRVALLRDAAGESLINIARRTQVNPSTPARLYRLHAECMSDRDYRRAYSDLVSAALESLHGDSAESHVR